MTLHLCTEVWGGTRYAGHRDGNDVKHVCERAGEHTTHRCACGAEETSR